MLKLVSHVYVAGPISKGDMLLNIRAGIVAGVELTKAGFVPYIPHLDFSARIFDPDTLDYETILRNDLAWVSRCDAVLRLPGESSGADREVKHAGALGIPVFGSIANIERFNHLYMESGVRPAILTITGVDGSIRDQSIAPGVSFGLTGEPLGSGTQDGRGETPVRLNSIISTGVVGRGVHLGSTEVRRSQLAKGNTVQQDLFGHDAPRLEVVEG